MDEMKQIGHFQFIDFIKGLAILLVIVGHLIQGNATIGGGNNLIYGWIYMYHMGLFFACSGFLYKWKDDPSGIKPFLVELYKKTARLLIPFLIWGLIMHIYDDREWKFIESIQYIIIHPHYGLWFLQSLLKYYVLIIFINYISFKLNGICKHARGMIILLVLVVSVFYHCGHKFAFIVDWNFCMFLIGLILRQYTRLWEIANNKFLSTMSAAGLFLPLFINFPFKEIVSISALLSFIAIAQTNTVPRFIKTQIEDIGKKSMPIYLLHFFFVIRICQLDLFANQVFEFFFLLALSVIIACCSIIIYRNLSFGMLPMLLWGEKKTF